MKPAVKFADTVKTRGYGPRWSSGCLCPGCGRSHWHVGRTLAECAFCETAIPFAPGQPAAADNLLPFRPVPRAPETPAGFPLPAGETPFRRSTQSAPHADASSRRSTSEAPAASPTAAGAPISERG